ncbi:MAG: M15 family metallopeptidase [Bacilli bacterium]|nr:M15 family metallopeptidase [Bacilli bacterium]
MKRRLKIKPIVTLLFVVAFIIFSIIFAVRTINYHKTYEYKLLKLGYSKEDVVEILKMKNKTKDYLVSIEYNKNVIPLLNEKYFLEKNLKKYIEYLNENGRDLADTIAVINVGSDNEWYTNTKKTDISKNELMLTNKFYSLDNSYNSDNMVKISKQYSYGNNQMLTQETYNAFIKMFKAAKKEDLTLIINSSYRSYEDQEEIYNEYLDNRGEEAANKIAAKAGFSEHQTGMAIDIQTYGSNAKTFEEFDEFKWLKDNAHKYGFILRYPKDKEYLTGYEYESWHYRYVGIEVATYIYENNITFDEYYAYFVEKG